MALKALNNPMTQGSNLVFTHVSTHHTRTLIYSPVPLNNRDTSREIHCQAISSLCEHPRVTDTTWMVQAAPHRGCMGGEGSP